MRTGIPRRAPVIGRIVIDGPPLGHFPSVAEPLSMAEAILTAVLRQWPTKATADFLITPGGFLYGLTPSGLSGKKSWQSDPDDFAKLVDAASLLVERLVTPRVASAAKGKCRYLTVGVDLGNEHGVEAELVAVLDLGCRKAVRWTGKSYPTPAQERTLIQIVDLDSHLLKLAGERILVLGCHDLNMFSPRAWANQLPSSPRRQRCGAMRNLVGDFEPSVILQHPHETDSPRIWRMPWLWLAKQFKGAVWASGICFYRGGRNERSDLRAVLSDTRSDPDDSRDFIVRTRETPIRIGERILSV